MQKKIAAPEIELDRSIADGTVHQPANCVSAEYVAQYAALCVRRSEDSIGGVEVLLITSRNSGRWIIPKGRPIRGKKPHQVARIEAWEEAGVRGNIRKSPFGYFSYTKSDSNGALLSCMVQVHLLNVLKLQTEFPESGQRELRWFSSTDAARIVKDPELSELIRGLKEQFRTGLPAN